MRRLDPLPPARKVDHWIVLDRIGEGGTATVYRVRHDSLGLVAALKVVAVPSRSIMERLRAEGRVMSRVRHRNIVGVRDVLDVDGSPGLLMDWISGPSLDQLLGRVELDLEEMDGLARGILRGMIAVHDAGLIHRDLKPGNILVAVEDGELVAKVADFGLAKDLVHGPGATRTGAMFGTPSYMSPEQIRDPKSVDPRSDVFSLGVVLYEMVGGAMAFPGDDVLDILVRIAEGRYKPIRELRPELPERMVEAIEAAIQVDRERRPASVAALLERWTAGSPDPAKARALDAGRLEQIRSLVSMPPELADGSLPPATTFPEEPASTPSSLSPPTRALPWLGVLGIGAASVVALVGCAGLLGVAGLAAWQSSAAAEVVAAAPPISSPPPLAVPAPELVPEPVVAPETPPSEAAPGPAPSRPRPAPRAKQPSVADPAPVAVPAAVPAPVPAAVEPADPAPPTVGEVRVEGDARRVVLRSSSGSTVSVGAAVPPGTYTLLAFFAEDSEPTTMGSVQVAAGELVVVRCAVALRKCQVR